MYTKGRKKGTIRFAIDPGNGARSVLLAGDFNQWQPARMRRRKGGGFAAVVPLGPGTYEYKFVVDEHWLLDRDHSSWAANPYGTLNSVAYVE